jgi:putative oxidoreductase
MVGHGLQKLAGKFGGPGLDGAAAGFEHMGMSPGKPYATAAALTETIGGGLLATGLFTPLGATMVTGAMTVAIGKVHGKNGLWLTDGGMEYNLALIAAAFAVTEHGAGFAGLDGLLTKKRKGLAWALLELGAGVGGGLAVMALADRSKTAVPDLADKVTEAASNASSAVADAAGQTADKVASAAQTVSEKANDAADVVAEKSADAANAVSDKADDAAETVSEKADDASDAVSDTDPADKVNSTATINP